MGEDLVCWREAQSLSAENVCRDNVQNQGYISETDELECNFLIYPLESIEFHKVYF